MKKGVTAVVLIVIVVFSVSFASAGFFSDMWNKLTGKATSPVPGNYWCNHADMNHDGQVNEADYKYLQDNYGEGSGDCSNSTSSTIQQYTNGDFNGDCFVDLQDFTIYRDNQGRKDCIGEHACDGNSDCGTLVEMPYCDGKTLRVNVTTPSCLSPAKMNSTCQNIKTQQSTPCSFGCSNGKCAGPSDVSPSDDVPLVGCVPSWNCGSWSVCLNSMQARTCTDANGCRNDTNKPLTSQTCTSQCSELWTCGDWSQCSNNQKTRTCTDAYSCGTVNPYPTTISCDAANPDEGNGTPRTGCEGITRNLTCSDADANKDGILDLQDSSLMKVTFGRTDCGSVNSWCNGTDINQDCIVDIQDFGVLKERFGETCGVPSQNVFVRVYEAARDAVLNLLGI